MTDPASLPPTVHRSTLGRAAFSGAFWAYASFVLSKALVFGTTVFLARVLTPEDFGVVGFATAVIGYLDIARDLGVGTALIARPIVHRRVASTAFFLSAGSGLVLAASVFLGSSLVGSLYGDPRAVPVTQAFSLSLLLSALGSTHGALLYRGLAFNRRVVPDVAQAAVKGVVSIGLAATGWGYWSLVIGQLAGSATFCVMCWLMQPFRPRLEWDGEAARWLVGFGSAVVTSSLLWGLLTASSAIIVGSQLGAEALGLFTLANRLPELALMSNYSILSTVLFPIYARLRQDHEGLRQSYLLGQRSMALVMLPAGVGMAIVAPLLVSVLYGPGWVAAGPLMQILALRYAVGAIGWQASDIAKALGHARLHLLMVAIPVAMLVPLLIPASRLYGLIGLVTIYTVGMLFSIALRVILIRHVLKLPVVEGLRALGPALIATLATVAGAGVFLLLTPQWPDVARLAGATALGTAAYVVALTYVGRELLLLLPSSLKSRLTGRGIRMS